MMEVLNQLLATRWLGNTAQDWLIAGLLFASTFLGLRFAKAILTRRLAPLVRATSTEVDDFLLRLLCHIGPAVYVVVAVLMAIRSLTLPNRLGQLIDGALFVVLAFKAIQLLQDLLVFFLSRSLLRNKGKDPAALTAARNVSLLARVVLWTVGVLFVVSNLGINVSSVVAGLGVGGVAVALAAQAVLKDAFSAFAIWMDKPFEVGDFIVVGDMLGTVEYVGFKTTRLRSLGGEQLVFSNTDLTDSRVRNYKRMETRRVLFQFGVVYSTPTEKLREIPGIVRAIVEAEELARFDRAHFASYGDSSLDFEVVYYVLSADYNRYMDVQQSINLRLKEELERRSVEFAFPTRQIYLARAGPE